MYWEEIRGSAIRIILHTDVKCTFSLKLNTEDMRRSGEAEEQRESSPPFARRLISLGLHQRCYSASTAGVRQLQEEDANRCDGASHEVTADRLLTIKQCEPGGK